MLNDSLSVKFKQGGRTIARGVGIFLFIFTCVRIIQLLYPVVRLQ